MAEIHKLKDEKNEFSQGELDLIMAYRAIFENPDALLCPECEREKSPMINGMSGRLPCLYCIEEAIQKQKAIYVKHLPERWPAGPSTIQLAHELIKKYHTKASGAAVAYIFKAKHAETAGKVVLGTCAKQSPKSKLLHGWDYIIELAWDFWCALNQTQREAMLLHELMHIDWDEDVWKIQPHSVEEHTEVIEAYGLWKPDLQAFARAIMELEDGGGQMRLPLVVSAAAKAFADGMNEGDSIQATGPGYKSPKIVKRNGKIVEEN
jgi:hypothetical protein